MAKKIIINKDVEEIKKFLETDKLILGTERVVKELKKGTLLKVFLSSNCPKEVMEDIAHYSSIAASVEVINLLVPNDELGVVCKKPFAVSVLGLLKK
jgi:large subunit ribosomal protein L30e